MLDVTPTPDGVAVQLGATVQQWPLDAWHDLVTEFRCGRTPAAVQVRPDGGADLAIDDVVIGLAAAEWEAFGERLRSGELDFPQALGGGHAT